MDMGLRSRDWGAFVIGEIFNVYSTSSGIDKNKLIIGVGNIPYITRTDTNNGCDLFVCIQDGRYTTEKGNVITVGLDTQTVFYQEKAFYTGQNIQIIDVPGLNRFIALFLIPLLKKQMAKFNWGGNGATLTRLRKQKLFCRLMRVEVLIMYLWNPMSVK